MDMEDRLKNTGPATIAETINNLTNSPTYHITNVNNAVPRRDPAKPIQFRLRFPQEYFTGRLEELKLLDEALQRERVHGNKLKTLLTVVSGLGGIGKTQLVRQYVNENLSKYNNNAIWINAENENSIAESFKKLAKDVLHITTIDADGKEKSIESVVEDVYEFFRDRNCLFIYDNVDGKNHLRKFLPLRSHGPTILITSRIREWDKTISVIELQAWKPDEAIEFVEKMLSSPSMKLENGTHRDIKLLVEKLQYFPLALRQATAYIDYHQQMGDFSVSDYLLKYNEKAKELLDSTEFQENLENDYSKTTYTTWIITVTTIKENEKYGKMALNILHVIAYFASNDIHRSSLMDLSFDDDELQQTTNSEEMLKLAVRLLVMYSMIEGQEKQEVLSVHRLVQKVTRINLKREKREENILRSGLRLMDKLMIRSQHVSHAAAVYQHALEYDKLLQSFYSLSNTIAMNLICVKRSEEAVTFANKVLIRLTICLGEGHPIITRIKYNVVLGTAFAEDKALHIDCVKCEMYEEVFLKRKIEFGEEDPDTHDVQRIIGQIHLKCGYYEEALTIFQAMQPCHVGTKELIADTYSKMYLFDEKLQILQEMHALFEKLEVKEIFLSYWQYRIGVTLIKLRRFKEALHTLEMIYEMATKENLPISNSGIKQSIAEAYIGLGRFDEAHSILHEEYTKAAEQFGSDHLNVIDIKSSIASIRFYQNDFTDALCHPQDLETLKKQVGESHPKVLEFINNMATQLQKQGRSEEASQILKTSYEKAVKIFGKNHRSVLHLQEGRAFVLFQQEKYLEALPIYEDILAANIGLGASHKKVILTKTKIAAALSNARRFQEAETVFEEINNSATDEFKETEEYQLEVKEAMAVFHFNQQNYEEAYLIYDEIRKNSIELFGENQPFVSTCKIHMADILLKQGKFSMASAIIEGMHEKYVKNNDEDHPEAIELQFRMANSLYLEKKFEDALKMYTNIWEKRLSQLGENNPLVLKVRCKIASTLCKQEKFHEAYTIFEEVHEKYLQQFGEGDQKTLIVRQELAQILIAQRKYIEAITLLEDILKINMEMMGETHLTSLNIKLDIAILFSEEKNFELSSKIFNEIYKIATAKLKNCHPTTLAIRKYWAQSFREQKKYEEAVTLYNEALVTINDEFGENHPDSLPIKVSIADLLSVQGKFNEAIEILKVVYQLSASEKESKECTREDKIITIEIGQTMFRLYCRQMIYDDVLPLLKSMKRISYSTYGENHLVSLEIRFNIAFILAKLGKYNTAAKTLEDVYNKHVAQFGKDHKRFHLQAAIIMQQQRLSNITKWNDRKAHLRFRGSEASSKSRRIVTEEKPVLAADQKTRKAGFSIQFIILTVLLTVSFGILIYFLFYNKI